MNLTNKTPYPKVMDKLRLYPAHYLWQKDRKFWTEQDYENLNTGKETQQDWYSKKNARGERVALRDIVTGQEYRNISHAAKKLGMKASTLRGQLSGHAINKTNLIRL